MGRRENAVAADTRQSEALALWLRSQRERRGVTYAAMAKLTDYRFTASVLSRGASGHKVPTRRLVLAYAKACDADTGEAVRLWKAARRAEEERRRAGADPEFRDLARSLRSVMSHPELIDSFGKLHEAMVELRAREGQPSLGDLQRAAGLTPGGRHRLPKSSLSVILRGEAVPSRAHLTAFMEALKVSPRRIRLWERAWDRIAESPARKLSPAVEFKVLEDPPVRKSDDGHAPTTISTEDLDFLREQVQFDATGPFAPGAQKGPQFAYPPAGYTRSGLPIRRPRHYEGSYQRPPYEPLFITRMWTAPQQPQNAPPSHFPTAQERTPVGHAPRPAKSSAPTAPPRRLTLVVDRWFPRKVRHDHTRWPNY
ncbi:helix-turn-helix transcriptional regulator [Streptomyces sp. MS1.AVA.3]|uniref:helix-turn-helix domain-containing protein n=1 Tax=Streptomyces decoyicus TaxID=249567 RepID=UPI0030BBB090